MFRVYFTFLSFFSVKLVNGSNRCFRLTLIFILNKSLLHILSQQFKERGTFKFEITIEKINFIIE